MKFCSVKTFLILDSLVVLVIKKDLCHLCNLLNFFNAFPVLLFDVREQGEIVCLDIIPLTKMKTTTISPTDSSKQ